MILLTAWALGLAVVLLAFPLIERAFAWWDAR